MQFLKDFWMGDISPGETRYRHDREYFKALQIMEESEARLKEVLSEDNWQIFRQFVDAAQKISADAECDNFMEGFRMGAKMMMDVLSDPQNLSH